MLVRKEQYVVAVVGATGAVGEEMLAILASRQFPVERLIPLASERSVGAAVEFQGREIPVQALNSDSFAGVDIALFSAGASVSREFAPIAAAAGALVVDNSSAFRMERDIPLVVPEVNATALQSWRTRGIVANPNCSTIQLCVILKPLHDRAGLARVTVATYQATSGAGRRAMEEMTRQVQALFAADDPQHDIMPHPIAFNCLPQIDDFLENGYTKEEWKIMQETRKILSLPDLPISATAVRVPVYVGHSEAVHLELQAALSAADARALLRESPGVVVVDDPSAGEYPMPRDVGGTDAVYVGRIRTDLAAQHGLALWVVADNLRKGAALNAVQIAEIVTQRYV